MKRNTAQKLGVFAYSKTTLLGVAGIAATITCKLSRDGAAAVALTDTNPTELESGYYAFDVTAAESNAQHIIPIVSTSTADTTVVIAGGITELTGQDVRDAMKLTPTAGNPEEDSIDEVLAQLVAKDLVLEAKIDATPINVWDAFLADANLLTTDFGGVLTRMVDSTWDEAMSGHTTSGTAGAYMARIGTATVAVTAPVATDATVDIYSGDDYNGSRALVFTCTGYTGEALATTHTGTFRLIPKTTYDLSSTAPAALSVNLTAANIVQVGTTVTITVVLTDTQTATLSGTTPPQGEDHYQCQIRVTSPTAYLYTLVDTTLTAARIIGAAAA
mgnify:CR=1 FL=1